MSNTHHAAATDAHSGDSDMNLKKIIFVGVASLVLFAIGAVWAYFIMVGRVADVRDKGAAREATEIGHDEIGIVDQVPFEIDRRIEHWREAHRKHLEGYGWVDKARGVVHIPIEKAIEEVVAHPPDIPGEGVPVRAAAPAVPPPAPPAAPEDSKKGSRRSHGATTPSETPAPAPAAPAPKTEEPAPAQ